MAAFELNDLSSPTAVNAQGCQKSSTIPENIICFKIYDSCRQQDCLDFSEIGPARAAETTTVGGHIVNEGEIVIPPCETASVSMDYVHVDKIAIVDKSPNCFRKGYWDIDLKYVIEYRLIFRNSNADVIWRARAKSVFNKKVTLFGSEGSELYVSTDLFGGNGMFEAMPFVMAEGKAMGLSASLVYENCFPRNDAYQNIEEMRPPSIVEVTIGLFSVIKLFRIVDLTVESRGFSVPEECDTPCPINPCEYFESLDFPMDIFAPPQKREFMAGISGNIPAASKNQCMPVEAEQSPQTVDPPKQEYRRPDAWK